MYKTKQELETKRKNSQKIKTITMFSVFFFAILLFGTIFSKSIFGESEHLSFITKKMYDCVFFVSLFGMFLSAFFYSLSRDVVSFNAKEINELDLKMLLFLATKDEVVKNSCIKIARLGRRPTYSEYYRIFRSQNKYSKKDVMLKLVDTSNIDNDFLKLL